MLLGLAAVMPLFLIIGGGYLARVTVLDSRMLPALNQFVYFFAVPALLFRAANNMAIERLINWPAITAFLLGVVITLLVGLLLLRLLGFTLPDIKPVAGMNATFANFAYMGIPVSAQVFGEQAQGITVIIILLGNLFIIGGTQLFLEAARHHQIGIATLWSILDRSLIRSPIFLSTSLGLLASVFGLVLPAMVQAAIDMLAGAAIPVALFCLGAGLQFKRLSTERGLLACLVVLKLVIHPVITWGCLLALGVSDPTWLAATVLMTALPTGALAHVVALKYNAYAETTSQVIVVSTLLSLLSISLWVDILV